MAQNRSECEYYRKKCKYIYSHINQRQISHRSSPTGDKKGKSYTGRKTLGERSFKYICRNIDQEMNKYIYILMAVVCAALGVRLTSRTISVTSHYIDESIHRETLTDYSIVDKRVSHTECKGSVTIGYLLTVSYADSLYLTEVPATVYDQVNPGIGVKLPNNELYYDHEQKSVKWPGESTSIRTVLTYWGLFALILFLIIYFLWKAKKASKQ